MNKEELKILKILINNKDIFYYEDYFNYKIRPLIGKLFDLYNKEKAKNKQYEKYLKNKDKEHEKVLEYRETEKEADYISKAKLREKIEEYENMKKKLNKAKDRERIKAINERLLAFQEILLGE